MANKKTETDDEALTLHQLVQKMLESIQSYTPEQKKNIVDALAKWMKRPKPEPQRWKN